MHGVFGTYKIVDQIANDKTLKIVFPRGGQRIHPIHGLETCNSYSIIIQIV